MTHPTSERLRQLLDDGLVVAPFVYDGLTARIAQQAGFGACYLSGHGMAAQAGLPDVGLISFGEIVETVRHVAGSVDVPVIADADTGYGNAYNVARTVIEYEAAGVAALHLEDQVFPKRCGFFEGKEVIALDEAALKVRAAVDARSGDGPLIIARTDALAPEGWGSVLERVAEFREAGADLVFVDGISTFDDLERYAADVASAGPALYNGSLVTTDQVAALGFAVTITGGGHLAAFIAVRDALDRLRVGDADRPLWDGDQFTAITDVLGLPEAPRVEVRYQTVGDPQ